MEGIA